MWSEEKGFDVTKILQIVFVLLFVVGGALSNKKLLDKQGDQENNNQQAVLSTFVKPVLTNDTTTQK